MHTDIDSLIVPSEHGPAHVLGLRDDFEVRRVIAGPDAAQVVDRQPVRDGTDVLLVHLPVDINVLAVDALAAVAGASFGATPNPAVTNGYIGIRRYHK
jgi:hypothetical protein